jgi:C-terminal processing protease CtpA/Prc
VSHEIEALKLMPETFNKVLSNKYEDTYYFSPAMLLMIFEMIEASKTGLLTIRSFSFETYASRQAYRNFIRNSFLLMRLNHIQQLIIDCRSNSGGIIWILIFCFRIYWMKQDLNLTRL